MFSASISPLIFRDCDLAWAAGFDPYSGLATKSATVGLAHFHVLQPVVKSVELVADWASLPAFAETLLFFTVADENTFFADEILKTRFSLPASMCSEKSRETPDPTPVIHTILLLSRWLESRISSGGGSASLRRLTKPLRGFIRRRLARGACRPPSIPPVSATFEHVHAFAWVGSAP